MKIVIQRVKEARVTVNSQIIGEIKQGILVFLGVAHHDSSFQADQLIKKIIELRIFDDEQGKMNLSALDKGAEFLIV